MLHLISCTQSWDIHIGHELEFEISHGYQGGICTLHFLTVQILSFSNDPKYPLSTKNKAQAHCGVTTLFCKTLQFSNHNSEIWWFALSIKVQYSNCESRVVLRLRARPKTLIKIEHNIMNTQALVYFFVRHFIYLTFCKISTKLFQKSNG